MTGYASGGYIPDAAHGSCPTGKVQFATRKQARHARRRTAASQLSIYKCECGWFHLGHQPDAVRRGTYDKATWQQRMAQRRAAQ